MNAVLQIEPTKPDTILNYATDQELDQVRQIFIRGDALKADVIHIQIALGVTLRNLERNRTNVVDRMRNAAARALGESVHSGPAMERTLLDLQDEEKGLLVRLAEAENVAKKHAGDYRAAVCQLIRKCAERCAEDYVESTKRQAWAHMQLSIAEGLIGRVVDHAYWSKYIVPGSDHLNALKNKSRMEDDNAGVPCLTYMSADKLARGQKGAADELRQYLHALFGASPL